MKYKVCCIGAGGTGGYFLKEFSRYLGGFRENISGLYVIDGDIVEEHNLSRQCFAEEDIGQYKSSVLAEILNDTFGVRWRSIPRYLENVEQLEEILELQGDEMPIILGCVDNHGCRLVCEKFYNKAENCIYFDSANEVESGEVVFCYKMKGRTSSPLRSEIFPDILQGDTRNVTEMSCEELNVVHPQHITVNMYAGLILLSAVTGLLEHGTIKPGFTSFNAASMTSEFIPLVNKEVA